MIAEPAVNDGASVAISGAAQVGQVLTAEVTDTNGVRALLAINGRPMVLPLMMLPLQTTP